MSEKELAFREKMEARIEKFFGIYEAVWNEWPTHQIRKLYKYVLDTEYEKFRITQLEWKNLRDRAGL